MLSTIKGLKMNVSVNVEIGECTLENNNERRHNKEFYKDAKAGINFNLEIDEATDEMTPEELTELIKMLGSALKNNIQKQITSTEDEKTVEEATTEDDSDCEALKETAKSWDDGLDDKEGKDTAEDSKLKGWDEV